MPDVPICIPCAEELLTRTYGAANAPQSAIQYMPAPYPEDRLTIGFILNTPALLQAARAAGYEEARRPAMVAVPPSDGEVDGLHLCSECATAYHKAKRALAEGKPGIEIV